MKLPRPAVLIWAFAAFVIVSVVIAALLLPRLIDSQLVKDKIAAQLADQGKGRVRLGRISTQWYPRPGVVVENAEFSDNETRGLIQTARIYPSIYHLITGRLVVHRVVLEKPELISSLPANSATSFDIDELEKKVRSALVALTKAMPAPRVDVSGGSAEIRITGKPPVLLENVTIRVANSPAELRFDLSARANLCERFKLGGVLSPENLASRLDIEIERLKISEFRVFLPPDIAEYAPQGEASLGMTIASIGLSQVNASFEGSAGSLVFVRNGSTATIVAKNLRGEVAYKDGNLQLDVERLDLGSPRLQASGELESRGGLLSARMKIRDIDITEVGAVVLRITGDAEGVKRVFRYVPAGRIPEVNIETAGRSFAELTSIKNVALSGILRDGRIFIPEPNLDLESVNGAVRFSGGIIEADRISAKLGEAKGWNGKLRLGIEAANAPFHLDVWLSTGVRELHSLLLKVVHDRAFRSELLKLRNLDGDLTGRLILGETLDGVSPVVEVSAANISALYDPVPFPFTIRGGRLRYDQKVVRMDNMQGAVGRSIFREIDMTLQRDGSRQFRIASKKGSLDLQQMSSVLRAFKDLRSPLDQLRSVGGQIEWANLTVAGAYDDPAGWMFASAGSFDRVEMKHANFPDRISVARGKFAVDQERIIVSEIAAAMSDASYVGGGSFAYDHTGPLRFEMHGVGNVGAQMTRWLGGYVKLPGELQPRSPLSIVAERAAWRAGEDVAFRGQVTVAGGPVLTLDVTAQPQRLTLRNLSVEDGGRQARMTVQLAEDNLDLSFSGELTHETVEKIFPSLPTKGSSLRGDIRMSAGLTKPITVSARGRLDGSDLVIPVGAQKKAVFEKFSIEASGQGVHVRSADLLWGKSRLALSGAVHGTKDLLRVEMDVSGDQLDWEELRSSFVTKSKQGQKESGRMVSVPDVEGVIRLKTDRFMIDRFTVNPLEATAVFSPSGVRTQIARGVVCGINATGAVDIGEKEIGLDLELSAKSAQLGPTTVCLTNQQSDVKGLYSLTARVSGRGDRERLRSALKGRFEFNAGDGEFVRADGLDAAFDYLNGSGDFTVNFPDLNQQALPFRSLAAKGRLDGENVFVDEVVIQAPPLTVTTQGSVDLQGKEIDMKGLVSVALPAHQVVKRIPIVGAIVGGSLVGIPMRVSGPLERPEVTYLSPADVGMELLTLPMRILGTPLEAIKLFAPGGEGRD
jgi:hypothetical protein